MMNPQNHISSQTARQILLDAENSGVSVENYLKNLAEEFHENGSRKVHLKSSTIGYDFAESRKWLEKNAKNYVGRWIVLDGANLIGCGENPVPLVKKARNEGVKIPFVRFIQDDSKPFMGGWL